MRLFGPERSKTQPQNQRLNIQKPKMARRDGLGGGWGLGWLQTCGKSFSRPPSGLRNPIVSINSLAARMNLQERWEAG